MMFCKISLNHPVDCYEKNNNQIKFEIVTTLKQFIVQHSISTRELSFWVWEVPFREIAFLAVLNFFPSSKIDFWPFLKLQKMEIGQKIFS